MENDNFRALCDILRESYGDRADEAVAGLCEERLTTLRVNTLKTCADDVFESLRAANIRFSTTAWSENAVIIENAHESDIRRLDIYREGKIYLQSLSSMIPPILLDPKPEDAILDMAAAPGGKTTQLAALSGGAAAITACEKNKIRAERLRFNLERQGANRVTVMVCDSRKLDDRFLFDKILLDAPCSGSGTASNLRCDFTEQLYRRCCELQAELLKKALRLLKPGRRMVYSTCSILPEENENLLLKILPKFSAKLAPIPENAFSGAKRLPCKIPEALLIMPDRLYEGFFAAIIEK